MLPTKDKIGSIHFVNNKYYPTNYAISRSDVKHFHLYICSSDEIKERDYVFTQDNESRIEKVNSNLDFHKTFKSKKVIATTDKSLNLPEIPEQFLKEFCDNGGIWEVEVEYEYGDMCQSRHNCSDCIDCDFYGDSVNCIFRKEKAFPLSENELPLIENNTINIRSANQTWTRDEVEQLCEKAYMSGINAKTFWEEDFENWLKENIN